MRQYDLALEKYLDIQSGFFRLVTTVMLGTGIKYADLLLCHGISEINGDKKITVREYNGRKVYGCFVNPLAYDCDTPAFNLHPMIKDDSHRPNIRAHYTSDPLPYTISVASKNSVITLTSSCESLPIHFTTSDPPSADHIMMRDGYDREKPKRGYCIKSHNGIKYLKN